MVKEYSIAISDCGTCKDWVCALALLAQMQYNMQPLPTQSPPMQPEATPLESTQPAPILRDARQARWLEVRVVGRDKQFPSRGSNELDEVLECRELKAALATLTSPATSFSNMDKTTHLRSQGVANVGDAMANASVKANVPALVNAPAVVNASALLKSSAVDVSASTSACMRDSVPPTSTSTSTRIPHMAMTPARVSTSASTHGPDVLAMTPMMMSNSMVSSSACMIREINAMTEREVDEAIELEEMYKQHLLLQL